jgi:hypothetical protein
MRQGQQPEARAGLDGKSRKRTASDLDRRFWVAMVLYAVLAALCWFTLGGGAILVDGKPVEIRLIPLVFFAALVLKTALARKAEKIRRDGDGEGGSASREFQKKG